VCPVTIMIILSKEVVVAFLTLNVRDHNKEITRA
jgi:hypothetical protein